MSAGWKFAPLLPGEAADWDALVRASPQGNAFLLDDTLTLLACNETPRAEVWRVGCRSAADNTLVGGWAVLLRQRSVLRYATSFPLFYAGPLLSSALSIPGAALHRAPVLQGLARVLQEKLDYLETEAAPELPDARGLVYANCAAEQIYTHLWPAGSMEAILKGMARSKRRELQNARRRHCFGWQTMSQEQLARFNHLHNLTLKKFKWQAPAHWQRSLLTNMDRLAERGICRLFTASAQDSINPTAEKSPEFCAGVSVLLSPDHRIAWLWRVAYQTDDPGLIPALYFEAASSVKAEFGEDWRINFGGSPRLSLSLFKDFLGADATPHWRVVWQRPGWKPFFWSLASATKELWRQRWEQLRSYGTGT